MKTLACLALLIGPVTSSEYGHAPVYTYAGPGVLKRVATFDYVIRPNVNILYCIAPDQWAVMIHCVMQTKDRLVLVETPSNGFKL